MTPVFSIFYILLINFTVTKLNLKTSYSPVKLPLFSFLLLENTNVNANANPNAANEASPNPNWCDPSNLIERNARANPPTPIPFARTLNPVEIKAPTVDPTKAA